MPPDTTESSPKREIEFEWNAAKASANLKKHRVSFEEAATVFEDIHALIQDDELHSDNEARSVIIGYSERNRVLVVSFVEQSPELVRLLSARAATRKERGIYEEKPDFQG